MQDIQRRRRLSVAIVLALAVLGVLLLARISHKPAVRVVTIQPAEAPALTRGPGTGSVGPQPQASTVTTPTCPGLSPGPSWACQNGTWQMAGAAGAAAANA